MINVTTEEVRSLVNNYHLQKVEFNSVSRARKFLCILRRIRSMKYAGNDKHYTNLFQIHFANCKYLKPIKIGSTTNEDEF